MTELMGVAAFDAALIVIAFSVAMLQSATGFGFGMIVGPMLLAFLDITDAVQSTGILTFGIVVVLAPSLARDCDRKTLVLLSAGTALGLPLGYILQVSVSKVMIHSLAVFVVAFVLVGLFRPRRSPAKPFGSRSKPWPGVGAGVLSGVMSTALAMPGPPAVGYLFRSGLAKIPIRATLVVLMIGSYAGMIGVHLFGQAISRTVIDQTIRLAPATLSGLIAGHFLASRISKRIFYLLTVLLLSGAFLSLAAAILRSTER
ncbi:MAG: sulfite exporter TauE/SafE family protein [Nitrospinae bacterium]|nr:sulfite exporter TauE/SafE family protein [Nitrospinota bacterium]